MRNLSYTLGTRCTIFHSLYSSGSANIVQLMPSIFIWRSLILRFNLITKTQSNFVFRDFKTCGTKRRLFCGFSCNRCSSNCRHCNDYYRFVIFLCSSFQTSSAVFYCNVISRISPWAFTSFSIFVSVCKICTRKEKDREK